MKSPLHPPARLSYVGVPRSLAWGYSYGAACLVGAGAALATDCVASSALTLIAAGLVACYLRFVGVRVRVAVWKRVSGDGYEVLTRAYGVSTRHIASRLPELEMRKLGNAELIGNNRWISSAQLALTLQLGSGALLLPSLHVGAGEADALARLAAFQQALLALRELDSVTSADTRGRAQREGGAWKYPEVPPRPGLKIEGMRWAKGEADRVLLRHGVRLPQTPRLRSAASLFGAALLLIAGSALLPSNSELARRAGFGGGAFAAALLAFALATYTVRIRFDRRGGPSAAAVVSEHSALGVVWVTRRVLLGDGLRVLYVQETHEDAESSNTMIRAYLTTRRGALHPLTGVGDEQDPSRELLNALGASIANTSLVEAVLSEPLPNEQPDVHPAHDPNYEEPPLTGPEPAPALRSHAAGVALWVGAFALLCGLGSAAFDLLALSHAKGWVQTTYYFTNEDKGKYHNLVARTQLDSSVNLNPRPAAGKAYSSNVCWVLDHPRGHDIARYTPPSGPPTLRDEIRYSTLAMLGICMLFAFAAAGPWLRARRSFLVYAG